MSFLVVSVASLAILVVVHGMTFLIGRRLGRYNVVDVTWGVGFVAVAAVCAAVGTGDLFRRLLLLVLVAVWGLRLAWHMVGKSAGRGEDPRYRALLRDDFSAKNVIRRIFLVQGAAGWFISLPLQVSAVLGPTPPALLPVLVVGVAVWLLGVVFEAVGDRQLRRFKADPANKGVVMDRGLWGWTRHPNYAVTIAETFLLPLVFADAAVAVIFGCVWSAVIYYKVLLEDAALAERRGEGQ